MRVSDCCILNQDKTLGSNKRSLDPNYKIIFFIIYLRTNIQRVVVIFTDVWRYQNTLTFILELLRTEEKVPLTALSAMWRTQKKWDSFYLIRHRVVWGMTYFCMLTRKLASQWFPQQKASEIYELDFRISLKRSSVTNTTLWYLHILLSKIISTAEHHFCIWLKVKSYC